MVIVGLFFKFTIVEMRGPNKTLNQGKHSNFQPKNYIEKGFFWRDKDTIESEIKSNWKIETKWK